MMLKILKTHTPRFKFGSDYARQNELREQRWANIRMFFDINGQPYEYVLDKNDATMFNPQYVENDHDLALTWTRDDKPKLVLDIWHNFEDQTQRYDRWLEDDKVHIITNAVSPIKRQRVHFVDFLFNRTKAYYSDFPWHPETQPWYWEGKGFYINREIDSGEQKTRIFVAPNRPYRHVNQPMARHYRRKLVELLKQHTDLGWVSDPLLFSNHDTDIDSLVPPVKPHQGYNPIHQDYYNRSFVSIYGETIEQGADIAVTEKTYEPLIHGHFILPFSNQGFVAHVKSMGIMLPDFIDYSYDQCSDAKQRWQIYQEEIKRLLSIPIATWQAHWKENMDLLKHNQDWFRKKPYDRVDIWEIIREP